MQKTFRLSTLFVLSSLVTACATPTPPAVLPVVSPQAVVPPLPSLVGQTIPKEAGYFQKSLQTYFCNSRTKPTLSTSPTPPAELILKTCE